MVWYDMAWYGLIWWIMVLHGIIWYSNGTIKWNRDEILGTKMCAAIWCYLARCQEFFLGGCPMSSTFCK